MGPPDSKDLDEVASEDHAEEALTSSPPEAVEEPSTARVDAESAVVAPEPPRSEPPRSEPPRSEPPPLEPPPPEPPPPEPPLFDEASSPEPTPDEPAPDEPTPDAPAPSERGFAGAFARFGRAGGSVVDSVAAFGRAMTTWAIWPFLIAGSVGGAAWIHRHPEHQKKFLESNELPYELRIKVATWAVVVLGAIMLLNLVAIALRRLLQKKWLVADTVTSTSRWLAFGLAAPVVAALEIAGIEKTSPKLTLALVAIGAAAITATAYQWRIAVEWVADRDLVRRVAARTRFAFPWIGLCGALALWALYGWYFSDLSVTNHHAMNTRTTDLGFYDNIFYQSIHGNYLGCTFIKAGYHGSAHFDPILVLLSPLYLIQPNAEFLLILQSFWLGAGAVPLYLLGMRKLGSPFVGLWLAATYLLHPAVHGANMYEFHSLTLAGPVVMWVLYFLERGAWKRYWLAVVVALLVREDVPLLLCFVGAASLLRSERVYRTTGLATVLISLIYFAIVKLFFMTSADIFMDGKEAYSFAYYYDDLIPQRKGFTELLSSVWANPVFVLQHVLEEKKILFLVTIFLPLFFLPFAAKRRRFMLVYGLLFILLASRPAVFSTHFQYTSVLLPLALVLVPDAMLRVRDGVHRLFDVDGARLVRAMAVGMVFASLLISWKHGAVVDNATFKGGFSRISRDLDERRTKRYEWLQETIRMIPPDASVGVSNTMGPHVSSRAEVYFYGKAKTEYVFVDERELKKGRKSAHQKAKKAKRIVELSRHGTMALFEVPGMLRRAKK